MTLSLSRRRFAHALGAGIGAAAFGPRLAAGTQTLPALDAAADAIQLHSNENPYGPSPAAREALAAAQSIAARYPDALEQRMIEAIAALHGVEPERVLLGCGSGEVLQVADLAFLGPERCVVAAEPTFEAVLEYARATRARPVKVPQTSDFRHDLEAMAAACGAETGLVYVCNPNNPTGTIVTRDELARFLARVPPRTIVLLDEAYHHFVEDPAYASGFAWLDAPNLVIVRTFSKIYGLAGMRLGYAVGSRPNIAAMRSHLVWSNANAAVLQAALVSLADPELVPRQRALNSQTREWLCRELARDRRRYIPSHTNFLMIHVGRDVTPVLAALREQGIVVGRRFPSMESWLRVSIGTRAEMEAFLAGLRRVAPAAPAA